MALSAAMDVKGPHLDGRGGRDMISAKTPPPAWVAEGSQGSWASS